MVVVVVHNIALASSFNEANSTCAFHVRYFSVFGCESGLHGIGTIGYLGQGRARQGRAASEHVCMYVSQQHAIGAFKSLFYR